MELLERFAAGDVDAFEALFRQYQGEVYRWLMRIVRNTAVAEDLTVETFWRMHRAHGPALHPKGTGAGNQSAQSVTVTGVAEAAVHPCSWAGAEAAAAHYPRWAVAEKTGEPLPFQKSGSIKGRRETPRLSAAAPSLCRRACLPIRRVAY